MDETYTNVHRAFLQACGRFGILNLKQAMDILAAVAKHDDAQRSIDEAALRTLVTEINGKLTEREMEQRLNFVHFEWDGISGEFLVLCNTFAAVGPSPANNEAECTFMKVLMEKIVTHDSHSISVMTAIHLSTTATQQQLTQSQSTSSSKKITKQRAEELLDEWVANGYFLLLHDDEIIILGPRSIAEFRDVLRTKFTDFIQICYICSEITMKPIICPNAECETPLDRHCFNGYVLKQKKCPACKSNWEIAE